MQKLITTTLFCLICISLTACSGSASVGYQPPVLPIRISINTNGELQVSWENSIQTPYGTFSAGVSSNLSELYSDRNGVLIVNVNGVNSVYDLNGKNNIAVTLESGYYQQIELRKEGNNWYFVADKVNSDISTPQLQVYANQGWQDTGVFIDAGKQVTVEYISGLWFITAGDGVSRDASGGPNSWICDLPQCHEPSHDFPKYALIGKVGDAGDLLKIGNRLDFVTNTAGILYLRPNYGDEDIAIYNPEGSIVVKITVR